MPFLRHNGIICLAMLLLGGMLSAPAQAYVVPINGYPKIQVNGSNTTSFNLNSVEGSAISYENDNFGNSEPLSNNSDLRLEADLLRDLKFTGLFSSSTFMPTRFDWNMLYDGNDAKVKLGQLLSANLGQNEFVTLNRSLVGVQVDVVLPKGKLTLISSKQRAVVRTDTIRGENISGPYQLTAWPVVSGSERVMVNGEPKKLGIDYKLVYMSGTLDFTTVIGPESTITVSYEAEVEGSLSGQLYGVHADYPLKGLRIGDLLVGVTHLALQGRAPGPVQYHKREYFQLVDDKYNDFIANGYQLQLQYTPVVPNSEEVIVNGAFARLRDVDYTINYTTGRITFLPGHQPALNSNVEISYLYQIAGGDGSDRAVTGLGMSWNGTRGWSSGLNLDVQAARSDLKAAQEITDEPHPMQLGILSLQPIILRGAPIDDQKPVKVEIDGVPLTPTPENPIPYTLDYQTGRLTIRTTAYDNRTYPVIVYISYATKPRQGNTAVSVKSGFGLGKKFHGTAVLRKVDPGFSPLEAVGYQSTQQSLEWMAGYELNKFITFSANGETTRHPDSAYVTGGAAQGQNLSYMLRVKKPKPYLPELTLRHAVNNSGKGENGEPDNSSGTDSLSLNWGIKDLSARFNLNRASSQNQLSQYRSLRDSIDFGVDYNPNERFRTSLNLTRYLSHITSQDKPNDAGGSNARLEMSYEASKRLVFTSSINTSQADATVNEYSGVLPEVVTRDITVNSTWRASKDLSVTLSQSINRNQGATFSNTASRSLNTYIYWNPHEWLNINGTWSRQVMNYTDVTGSATNNMVSLNAIITGLGKMELSLDGQHIWGSSLIPTAVTQLQQVGIVQPGSRQTLTRDTLTDPTLMLNGNRLTSFNTRLTYTITDKHALFVEGNITGTYQSGSAANDALNQSYGIGWDYSITNNLTFTLNASRKLRSDSTTQYGYTANALGANLSFNFL